MLQPKYLLVSSFLSIYLKARKLVRHSYSLLGSSAPPPPLQLKVSPQIRTTMAANFNLLDLSSSFLQLVNDNGHCYCIAALHLCNARAYSRAAF